MEDERFDVENDSAGQVDLTQEDLKQLLEYGYEITERLGDGKQREVYLAIHRRGGVIKPKSRVVKISKPEVDPESISAIILRESGDIDKKEVIASNKLQHRNIAEVVDNFILSDGRSVNVEDYYPGMDLEAIIKTTGRLTNDERGRDIIGQYLEGAAYMEKMGFLHRDHKPSNVILTHLGWVKISDLQSAAELSDVHSSCMPTRGSIAFSHPYFINSLIRGSPDCASAETEKYAVAATILFTLTGEKFPYKIVRDENGKEIKIGDKLYRIKLKKGDKEIETVNENRHEEELIWMLRGVPKSLKHLLYRSLSLKIPYEKGIHSVRDLRDEFKKTEKSFFQRFRESLVDGAKYFIPTISAAALFGAFVASAIFVSRQETRPTLREIFTEREYSKFSLENIAEGDRTYVDYYLTPYMKDARERLEEIEESGEYENVSLLMRQVQSIQGLNIRLTSSWLRACYLYQNKLEGYNQERSPRLGPSFVPKKFVELNSDRFNHADNLPQREAIIHGTHYLKQCMAPGRNVAEVFANYFSGNEDINTAVAKSGCIGFLPGHMPENRIGKGYQSWMPQYQKDLASMAMALYLITDEEGDIDWDKIPKQEFHDIEKASRLMNPGF